jgi:DNA polymerase III delta subunit
MRALVLLPGTDKAPAWAAGLDPKELIKHSLLPPFKRDEQCLDFARIEARALGFSGLPDKLLVPLVVSCGADRGLLSMELWKLFRVGGASPSAEDLRRSALGPLQGDVWGLLDALGKKDAGKAFRSLKILGREANVFRLLPLLGKQVSQWLVASHLLGKGEGSRIPQVLDLHPFVVKKSVLPPASKWSERALVALLRDLAQVATKARQGIVSPWCLLQAALARALSNQ